MINAFIAIINSIQNLNVERNTLINKYDSEDFINKEKFK